MGGHRQRTVLNEPAHTRHLRGRDPTEGPGLVLVGHERRPPTPHALEAPPARRNGAASHRQTNAQITTRLSHNHLPTQFFTILREVTTKWFT